MAPQQLPLDLSFRPATGRGDFLIGPGNADAVAWIDRYPDWPAPAAALCGALGSGKSHLLAVWQAASGAVVLSGPSLRVDGLDVRLADARAVAIDDADDVLEPDALFHLINMMKERGGHLLLTMCTEPGRWTAGPPDLRSRIAALPLLSMGPPDDALLQGVLLKQFSDRRIDPAPELLSFLAARMPRTFAAAGALVAEIDRLGLAERRRATVPLARKALANLGFTNETE